MPSQISPVEYYTSILFFARIYRKLENCKILQNSRTNQHNYRLNNNKH